MISAAPPPDRRADIQGLRALAVVLVVLFHLEIAPFGGGFVGVDVFFVISGFLIGGIVVRDIEAGSFSLPAYLVRRVRRIVPAMLAVLATVSCAATALLMPSELASYAWSLGFSAVFLANVHFWLHRGAYAESEHEVLLHMWTLGVEAQFYLFLPLIVLVLAKGGQRGVWIGLAALACASAASSILYPGPSFYMLPARLWEFLLGALIAITPFAAILRWRWLRELAAAGGFALILFAALSFDASTPFPGWRAAIPCVGAGAIIAAGKAGPTLMARALSLGPAVFVGAISYSLYLWHWPVIVLLELGWPVAELTPVMKLGAAAVSLALAAASWRWIEEPFRRGGVSTRALLRASFAAAAALVLAAFATIAAQGWPQRLSPPAQAIASALDYPLNNAMRSGACFIHNPSQSFDAAACIVTDDGRPEVLLAGDSHAAHLAPGLIRSFPGSAISQITAAGCRPVIAGEGRGYYPACLSMMQFALEDHARQHPPDLIILAGRWEEGDLEALRATIALLVGRGSPVLVIGPAAEWAQFVPRLLVMAQQRRASPQFADALLLADRAPLDQRMQALIEGEGIEGEGAAYFSLFSAQCRAGCLYFDDGGVPLVIDNSHFSREGSTFFARQIDHPALVATPSGS